MDKNSGGAKPKTSTSSNNNSSSSSSSRQNRSSNSSSTSQTPGAQQTRNRSPRRENNYVTRSRGALTGLRSNNNNAATTTTTTTSRRASTRSDNDDATPRRPTVPNSVARNSFSSSQTEKDTATATPQSSNTDQSPTRATGTRNPLGQSRGSYSRPVLRRRNRSLRSVEPLSMPAESPVGDLPRGFPLPGISGSMEDSKSERTVSPSESLQGAGTSLEQLSALRRKVLGLFGVVCCVVLCSDCVVWIG
ncbi:hypothetical protein ACOMHN_004681 [Nucella lapillus]